MPTVARNMSPSHYSEVGVVSTVKGEQSSSLPCTPAFSLLSYSPLFVGVVDVVTLGDL
jgi:hypothetical protein